MPERPLYLQEDCSRHDEGSGTLFFLDNRSKNASVCNGLRGKKKSVSPRAETHKELVWLIGSLLKMRRSIWFYVTCCSGFVGSAATVLLLLTACAAPGTRTIFYHSPGTSEDVTGTPFDSVAPSDSGHRETVQVDARVELNDVYHHPIGINLNYLMDDDALLRPAVGIVDALKALGVKYLRYPGGEKSDSYLWTIPPWPTAPGELTPMLSRTGPGEWPANSPFTFADMATLIPEILDFDEFMSICIALGCEPLIVVAADSPYVPAADFGRTPTLEELLESAAEWVRYANIIRGYDIKYWMIGNETWNITYSGGTDADTYAHDLIRFSRAMKAIDPSIKIIANGHGIKWWQRILEVASAYVDYLGISNYPVNQRWLGYETYRMSHVELDEAVQNAIEAIETYATPTDSERLGVIVTETNVINFDDSGWHNRNDIGHALVLFQIFGELLLQPRIAFTQYWTTRWIDVSSQSVPRVHDAMDKNGRLQATGMALAIWGNCLLDKMVYATDTEFVKVYASLGTTTQQLNIFLVNKDTEARNVSVEIKGHNSVAAVKLQSLLGNGFDDTAPIWRTGTAQLLDQRIDLTLPSVSITVAEIQTDSSLPDFSISEFSWK